MGWKKDLENRRKRSGLDVEIDYLKIFIRQIPTKYILEGDLEKASRYKKLGQNKLEQLAGRIFGGITALKQGWQKQLKYDKDVIISIFISRNINVVQISAGVPPSGEPLQKWKCFCNCNLTTGKILSAVRSGTVGTPYENIGLPNAPFYIYSVTVCQNKDVYIRFDNIIGNDFTPWVVDQKVILMAYKGFNFGCCYPDPIAVFGTTNAALFNASSCAGKREDSTSMDDHSWRTPFRILTFCALFLRYKEYYEVR